MRYTLRDPYGARTTILSSHHTLTEAWEALEKHRASKREQDRTSTAFLYDEERGEPLLG